MLIKVDAHATATNGDIKADREETSKLLEKFTEDQEDEDEEPNSDDGEEEPEDDNFEEDEDGDYNGEKASTKHTIKSKSVC